LKPRLAGMIRRIQDAPEGFAQKFRIGKPEATIPPLVSKSSVKICAAWEARSHVEPDREFAIAKAVSAEC